MTECMLKGKSAGAGWRQHDIPSNALLRLLQVDDEAAGIVAPGDRYHDGPRARGQLKGVLAADADAGYRNIELMAEVPTCVAGERIGNLTDQIAQVLMAHVGFLHPHEHDAQHALRCREGHESLAVSYTDL